MFPNPILKLIVSSFFYLGSNLLFWVSFEEALIIVIKLKVVIRVKVINFEFKFVMYFIMTKIIISSSIITAAAAAAAVVVVIVITTAGCEAIIADDFIKLKVVINFKFNAKYLKVGFEDHMMFIVIELIIAIMIESMIVIELIIKEEAFMAMNFAYFTPN